jgi:hypothetical protein
MEQIEGDHHDLRGLALQLVLQDREVGGRDHDLTVDDGRAGIDQEGVVGDLRPLGLDIPRIITGEWRGSGSVLRSRPCPNAQSIYEIRLTSAGGTLTV